MFTHVGMSSCSLIEKEVRHNKRVQFARGARRTAAPLRCAAAADAKRYRAERSSASLAGWKSPSGKGQPPTRIECWSH